MIEFLNYLIVSYNVWFTAPLAIVFLLALFRLVTGAMDFGDVDADVDMDADIDADADVDADIDTGSQGPSFGDVFGFLNVGRVPLMIVLMSLFVTWGIFGLIANAFLNIPGNPHRVWISCIIAFFCCFLGTRYISIALSKLFPESEKAINDVQLLGLSGRVISGQITTTFGTARVQVPDGPELTVSCRVEPDGITPVKGDTVILINYDGTKRIFDVKKSEMDLR
ncbi:DUF1449 family protein [Candidatus Poribacteria bacterium]|nr:DUF1449 family protein [Candidatus Poribacteria bacterium]MYA57726.1 DUF1449 family protein [Candidatus Poribacteria bacterium]